MGDLEEFCEELCNGLSQESEEAAAADAVRSSSSDTEDGCYLFCQFETWWSRLLKEHTKQIHRPKRLKVSQDVRPVRVISACSGLLPEASVLKAGPGLDWRCQCIELRGYTDSH